MDQTKIEIVKLVIMAAACLIAYTVRKDVLPLDRKSVV